MFDRRLTPTERLWGAGLGCLAFVSLVLGSFAGLALFGWILLGEGAFQPAVLLWFLPALVSIALGIWTWRTRRTAVFGSLAGILGGAGGLGVAAVFVSVGLLLKVLGSRGG